MPAPLRLSAYVDCRGRAQHPRREQRLRSGDREGSGRLSSVLQTEPLNATGSIQQLLLPRKEWMAIGADIQMQFRDGGTGLPAIAAGAVDCRRGVLGVNFGLHVHLWSSEWRTD